ncbi:hypothetical protein [Amycolatopsis sp. NPDC004625]|uniref:hypothetical protein n=1 Tax=Amycolatopsis sp. NPDC004625 TaxID=3154670 RepID=UPI0033B286ED
MTSRAGLSRSARPGTAPGRSWPMAGASLARSWPVAGASPARLWPMAGASPARSSASRAAGERPEIAPVRGAAA